MCSMCLCVKKSTCYMPHQILFLILSPIQPINMPRNFSPFLQANSIILFRMYTSIKSRISRFHSHFPESCKRASHKIDLSDLISFPAHMRFIYERKRFAKQINKYCGGSSSLNSMPRRKRRERWIRPKRFPLLINELWNESIRSF